MAWRDLDLAVIAAWALVGLALALLDAPTWLLLPVGLPVVLLLPGLGILALSHPDPLPHRRSLAVPERLAWGLVLSLVVVLVAGLVLDSTVGLTRTSVVSSLAGVTLLATALGAVVRRAEWPQERLGASPGRPRAQRTVAEVASWALLAVVAIAVAAVAFPFLQATAERDYTMLAFVDPASHLCHPMEWREDALRYNATRTGCPAEADLVVGIANHEGRRMTYRLWTTWESTPGDPVGNGPVVQEEAFELEAAPRQAGPFFQHTVDLRVPEPPAGAPGSTIYLKVVLYEEGDTSPLAHLQLRVRLA